MSITTKVSAVVSKILGYITPTVVEVAGVSLAIVGAVMLHGRSREIVLAMEGIYALDRFRPGVFNSIKNFAQPTTWPGYVSMGVGSLLAAHSGGNPGMAFVAGVLMTGVGRLFNQLY